MHAPLYLQWEFILLLIQLEINFINQLYVRLSQLARHSMTSVGEIFGLYILVIWCM
jgi:hypothetical protein